MRKSAIILASVALIGSMSVAAPAPAQARGGFLPGIAGGLIAGAIINGIASEAYGYRTPDVYYEPYAYGPYPRPYFAGYSPFYGGYAYGPRYYRPYDYSFAYRYPAPRYAYSYYPASRYAYRYHTPQYGYRHSNYSYASYGWPHRNWRASKNKYRGHLHHIHHAMHRH